MFNLFPHFIYFQKTGQNLDYQRKGKEREEIRENIKAEINDGSKKSKREKVKVTETEEKTKKG